MNTVAPIAIPAPEKWADITLQVRLSRRSLADVRYALKSRPDSGHAGRPSCAKSRSRQTVLTMRSSHSFNRGSVAEMRADIHLRR